MSTRNPSLNNLTASLSKTALVDDVSEFEAELHGPRGEWWWTGRAPRDTAGFDHSAGVLRALPLPSLKTATRQEVLDYFDNCWTTTEILFASLQGWDAFVRQPYHQLRHPKIFYYGHPAVVYVNKFRVAGLLEGPIDPFIEQVFETGVDEMSWDDLSQGRDDWPSVRIVHEYRKKAYDVIRNVIETHPGLEPGSLPVTWDDPCWAVFMGFEHERIHLETSSVLIRELPLSSVRKPEFWPDYHPSTVHPSTILPTEGIDYPANDELVAVGGETVVLGKPMDYPSFGWDNEYGSKVVDVTSFRASRFKVTNGEFLRFVRARGYSTPKYWSTEGWGWRTFRNVKWPTFWIPDGPQGLHRYKLRALFDSIDMRWDWPVDVNYHEAKAYCAWRAEKDGSEVMYRIITEAEHMLLRNTRDRADSLGALYGQHSDKKAMALADETINVDACMQASGIDIAAKIGFNLQLAYGSQNPVNELPPSEKGFYDTLGNAWEWGEDHYAAFPGFKVHPYYDDFSSPCFGGKHNLIIGGSFMSTGQLGSKFARYQFRPHFFQHASFRVVCQDVDTSVYDMKRYGRDNPIVPYFPTSCMDSAEPHVGDGPCCSEKRRCAFTPTIEEGIEQSRAMQDATQILYESDALVSQYLSMHFGPPDKVYPAALLGEGGLLQASLDAPRMAAEELAAWAKRAGLSMARALDLGCAVGRATFELASPECGRFHEAVGLDISARFIEVANKMREARRMDYDLKVEGEITERVAAVLEETVDTARVKFLQGDACRLPSDLASGTFDAVLVANVLDRVPDPSRLLSQMAEALCPGGVALITTPFSWSDKYTGRANWIGGTHKDGEAQRSIDVLNKMLSDKFKILQEDSMPLLLAEHSRKFELLLTHRFIVQKK
ncbi:hypothetical protein CEUSTIGMA_g7390.t1 [Chlamydomonas eustigma]|uniref:Sulfatase-modifying factor enzyme domain-containing protein n=1 Tax=Chlamydomonas eustigma TaxID=1157962 RepID=A0A250XA34_9CHLO|nr:hypothetical protein CEUSTIGMA_g7390.t1 [Chlamydomonas eustigma]|eukprot:GAX79951.1 hypothetical protein CEUSTIGMA_g7390.t1 [Chlamydomonas eustigma]